jgi:hypothetical protein
MGRPHTARPGSVKLHKGSRKRLGRIALIDSSPIEFCAFAAVVLLILALLFCELFVL